MRGEREMIFQAALDTVVEFETKAKEQGISPSHETVVYGRDAISTMLYNLGYSQREFLTWVSEQRELPASDVVLELDDGE